MIKNGVSRALLAAAILSPTLVAAQQQPRAQSPFNYTYAEIAYDETDFDLPGANDLDGDGLTLSGSYAITDEWHAYASYATADIDDFNVDIDTWTIGAGYRYPFRDNIDIYGRILYISTEADLPGPGDADDDGLGLQVRMRARMNDQLELEAGIQHLDVTDSDTSLQGSARYYFTDQFSAGIGVTVGGDTDSFGINARFSF